jgi:DNA polymerase III subunit gamma/tau
MSYQVLARKWRPRTFQNMVGQGPILRMLANALEQKRIHHAYLFTGTRGVGKTTLARILVKCLNCESGVTPNPCGQCHACQTIDAGQFLDLYEVDAASRTKVEDTRELLDNVLYPPTQGRYKIYLIDEVHMLSNHSFNALLKTLEEPPEHVKFLLATTDPKRLPITILSRCLQFHLKRIMPEQIAHHLQHICEMETITYEAPALEKLAKAADGSMRDALSLLDQAIAYGDGGVNKNDVHAMLGSMAQDDLLPLLTALSLQDGKQLFKVMRHVAERAPDFHQVLEECISLLHKIAIVQIVPDAMAVDDAITTLAKRFSPEDVQLYYQIALLGRRDLSLTPSPQQGFEMTLLRMLAFKPGLSISDSIPTPPASKPKTPAALTSAQEKKIDPCSFKTGLATHTEQPSQPAPVLELTAELTAESTIGPTEWREILPKLELSGMAYALASNCTLEKITGNKVKLTLSANHEPMLNQKLKERITDALVRHLKQPIQLDIAITSVELATPVKQQQHEREQRLAGAKQTILQDPLLKKIIEMYDATVEVSLVT